MPWNTAVAKEMDPQGTTNCFEEPKPDAPSGYEGRQASECVWVQFWVELASAEQAASYRDFLAGYVAEQRKLGRFPRLVEGAAVAHEPHRIGFYLYDLAGEFHALWNRGKDLPQLRFIHEKDRELTRARVALVVATRRVLASGLSILGVHPMQEMH